MHPDAELLQRYAAQRDERAFAELVRRHLGLVHAAALRRTGGRAHLAEEIAQKVFTDLARKAGQLRDHPTLTGWLYRGTRYAAIDALRAEQRREKLAQALTVMPDESLSAEPGADWEQLRPVIDEAMDDLKEADREIMLLRFFQGLTFPEIASRLELSENAARMRTERALDKLRGQLGKRGITSTAALAGLLASESAVAAPAGLAASVTTAALTTAPAGAVASLFTLILMNKPIIVCLSAALAAGVTSITWASLPGNASETDLEALRAENARLLTASAPDASSAAVTAVAAESAARMRALVNVMGKKVAQRNADGLNGYRDCGLATPHDGVRTMAWAMATGDVATVARVVTYDAEGQRVIREIFDSMPVEMRERYRTPEEMMAVFWIARTLLNPPPSVEVWEKKITSAELIQQGSDRAVFRQPGQKGPGVMMVLTSEGWKWEFPGKSLLKVVETILSNETLAKLGVL